MEKLQKYISPFAVVKSGGTNRTIDAVVNIDFSSDIKSGNGIWEGKKSEYQIQLQYFGDYDKHKLINRAVKFILKHASASNIYEAVRSSIHRSAQNYQKMKVLQTQVLNGGSVASNPEACFITVRIDEAVPEDMRVDKEVNWHLDRKIYAPDHPDDVNSIYAATLLGKPTLILQPRSSLPAELQNIGEEFRELGSGKLIRKLHESNVPPEEYLEDIKTGDVIRFSWGKSNSVVHAAGSESGDSDRIVVLLAFGSVKEIAQLGKKFGYRKSRS